MSEIERTAAEIAANVTPINYQYPPGNILRYGADPTGVANSDNAGQAMLNQRAAGGAVGYVPTGIYKQTVVWTYPLSTTSLVLHGDGIEASSITTALNIEQLTNAGADASNGLFFPHIYDIEFRNTFPVTAGAGATNFHIRLKNSLRALIDNVRCRSAFGDTDQNDANHGGIWFELVGGFAASFLNIVDRCWMDHCQILMDTSDSVVSNSFVYGHPCQYGIKANNGNLTVTHCQIIGSPSKGGVWIAGGALNCKVTNNFFDGSNDFVNSGYGVVAEPVPGASNFLQVNGNTFWRQFYAGVRAVDAVAMTIAGNSFWNCGRADSTGDALNSDIVLAGGTFGCNRNTITGNSAFRGTTRSNRGLFILEDAQGFDATNNVYVANTISATASQYKDVCIVKNRSRYNGGSKSIGNIGCGSETEIDSSFTGTGTGFTSAPTVAIKYSVADNKVTLFFPTMGGTSNQATFTVTGMPSAIRPAEGAYGTVIVKNNGTDELGIVNVQAGTGLISVFRTVGGLSLFSFTSSGRKEISAGSTITYPLT